MTNVRRTTIILCSLLLVLNITCGAFALTWTDQLPQTPTIDVYYDFRPTIMGQPNLITPWQAGLAMSAFQVWSSVSNLHFIQNVWAPENQIINIGATSIDGQWGILGQGGYNYTNAGGSWHIAGGIVDMDANENWDPIIGNGNPQGSFDFFTVAAHEIGHAVGLDHSANSNDLMYAYYTGEKTWASATDVASIQSLYGSPSSNYATEKFDRLEAVPEPSTIVLLMLGLAMLIMRKVRIDSMCQQDRHTI
ncbi:MAG: matrixin family metalloprotease [Nitrospirota bacterium]|nr:matrixin family metalloprotease [Nitrospirota bacterium]